MITSLLYQIKFNADTNSLTSCECVGVVTSDVNIQCIKRVFDEFTVYTNAIDENEATKSAMKLICNPLTP
jgi:uracil phosphoribosyltransferase